MIGIADDSVLTRFEENELQKSSARKEIDGKTIYLSRDLMMPKEMDVPVLCDFGSAMPGEVEHFEDVQPDIYRAPEVILESGWTYSADIWNVGCMVRLGAPKFRNKLYIFTYHRCGTFSKADTYLRVKIRS